MTRRSTTVLVFLLILFLLCKSPSTFSSTAANGPVFIRANGSIDPVSAPIQRNDSVYTLIGDITSFSDGIVVETDGITLDGAGYTVQGLVNSSAPLIAQAIGINLTGRSGVTVENTTVAGFADGILLSPSSNGVGGASNLNTIVGNNLTNDGNGVYMTFSSNGSVYANDISVSGCGINVASFSNNNSIYGNSLTENGLGIYLTAADSNYVYENSISSISDGIRLDASSNNSVAFNTLASNGGYGIILLNSSDYNVILENSITESDEGLTLRSFSSCNGVVGNYVGGNYRGLEFIDSLNDTVASNNITGSGWFNFRLLRCSGNVVYENSITNGPYTVWLDSSSNNTFYHNFMGNLGVYLAPSTHSNVWDEGYPSGGNYWAGSNVTDQYSGTYQNVTRSDGIADTPVVFDANDTDRYPLAGPFFSFSATSGQQIQMASNSTISNFLFNGTAVLFDMIGEDGTSGFCRICVPSDLMSGAFRVYANGTQISYALTLGSNGTFSYLYFSLHFSTQEINVVPEHLSTELLFVFMFATGLAALVYKKKH